jgi:molybdenum cofactor biosynthesis enzyme MoaA
MALLPLLQTDAPAVRLAHLDDLWFQVGGTRCNLTCTHCFISCSPHNDRFGFLSLANVEKALAESVALGVKEYYFTGGEPFLNPDMVPILERTLEVGPATVLTNATVLKDEWLERLAAAAARSTYSLEFRVSIDGSSAASNDPIRGEGTFDRAMAGVRQLLRFGFLPIITAAQVNEDDVDLAQRFAAVLKANGYDRPRVKILPLLRIGAEEQRCRGYNAEERVTAEMMAGFDESTLLCEHSRIVTDRGVYVCPILIEAADARLGDTLAEAAVPYPLRHAACFTCYQYGTICANPSAGGRNA